MATKTHFVHVVPGAKKHKDIFKMSGAQLRETAVGRTARAKAAKAEIARREANALAKKAGA
jgi:hypothetical protein